MRYLLPQLISAAAARSPDRPAISCRGETLNYAELKRRSACLAAYLRANGVGVGDRIGILMYKHVDCATAIYGILAAGAAYVPLDPTAPLSRLSFVLENCAIDTLITEPRKLSALQELGGRTRLRCIVGLDDLDGLAPIGCSWAAICSGGATDYPHLGLTENALAYILFTSGSTGVPKGIMHTHGSALAWAEVTASSYGLKAQDRISNYAPLHFDLSTLDYFGAARAAACTVVIPEEHTRFPASLAALIADEALSVFYTVPYALLQLLRSGVLAQYDYTALRTVLFGGEPIAPKYLRQLKECWPRAELYNVYGPTETNGVTHQLIGEAELQADAPVPIGAVYPNVEALVIDSEGRELGDDCVGELCICAGTAMRGYWQRPDLNGRVIWSRQADHQRPDVFVRTGDLVKRRGDGVFEFCGRRDRLVKTRGYRVELDEVEAAIVAHSGVTEAAAFTIPDPSGSVRIVAALVPLERSAFTLSDLQRHLRERLSAYALPQSIDVLDDLPRTSTGKIDRVSLANSAAAMTEES